MSESGRGIIGILIAGIGYAILKLGDEFVIILDELMRWLDGSLMFRISVDDIFEAIYETEVTLQTIVLALLSIFLILAITDYIMSEV